MGTLTINSQDLSEEISTDQSNIIEEEAQLLNPDEQFQLAFDLIRSQKFEQAINKKFNSKFAVAINSGTSAIHLSLRTIGVASGDEVLVSSLTFVATINPILYFLNSYSWREQGYDLESVKRGYNILADHLGVKEKNEANNTATNL